MITNTFKIGINPKILDKARNFFNSTTEDILNELLQNSRRAGATKVKVFKSINANTVSIEDNGVGIFSKGVAINLGGSEWSSETQEREDPAGCGLFSLANLASVIESHGKKVRLDAEAFSGAKEVEVEKSDFSRGTRITFRNTEEEFYFKCELERACKFYPVQVEYNGAELNKPKDFLEDAVYEEEWEGLKIGILKLHQRYTSEFKLNFYGLEINCHDLRRPSFSRALGQDDLFVRVDIVDCPKLQLVLPSRKEVVSNDFLPLLFQQCKKVVFNYIKNYCDDGGSHTLRYELWLEAKESFSIELPEAEQKLIKWYPETHDYHNEFSSEEVSVVATNAVVYNVVQEGYEEHTLHHALENNSEQITLVSQNTDYKGYQWYESLARLEEVKAEFTYGNNKLSLEELLDDYKDRPDSTELELLIEQDDVQGTLTLLTDLVLAREEYCCDLDEVVVILTKDSKIKVEELVDILTLCFFSPSDDRDCDSYDTQAEYFSGEVWSLARSLLLSQEEAVQARIQEAVENSISWLVPSGNTAVIKVQRGVVTVELTEEATNSVKES
jgi:hypothetical protein